MTLWHEGIKGPVASDPVQAATYVKEMIQFVNGRKFDRVYLQAQDPSQQKNGKPLYAYSQPEFVVKNYLAPLDAINNQIDTSKYSPVAAGLLVIVDPQYSWTYKSETRGGILYNNPGYTNAIGNKDGTCNVPYRYCEPDAKQSMCFQADKAKKNPCGPIQYWCTKEKPCCKQFNTGCPNNFEQAFQFIHDVNSLARKSGLKTVITTVSLDGEDIGLYGADPLGMAQAWQAAYTYAPDINEIGVAKQGSLTADALGSNAAFPELYWIGELQYSPRTAPCKLCKAASDMWDSTNQTCQNCLSKIYQIYRNQPECMLDAWYPYLNSGKTQSSPSSSCTNPPIKNRLDNLGSAINAHNLAASQGTCPLISIEHAHSDPGLEARGTQGVLDWVKAQQTAPHPTNDCIQKKYAKDSGICGTFDGFGNWDWDSFEKFLVLLAMKYNFKELGVYEYQFVPPQWQSNLPPAPEPTPMPTPEQPTLSGCVPASPSSCIQPWVLPVSIGSVILVLGLFLILGLWLQQRKQ
jgi:hypothetical protein